ncbi:hypothetical protein QBC40DRAFT_71412 [Triangularia verruculosa]|uniref:Uncharacterized protein n=1 Tax=Triangularia verruculosa TaxID=2587418 RepID=A0AAN6XMA9_9PEZI|nr:hypothetical protein QBC40DRAFT_71412 [Triangularia verruculosa]
MEYTTRRRIAWDIIGFAEHSLWGLLFLFNRFFALREGLTFVFTFAGGGLIWGVQGTYLGTGFLLKGGVVCIYFVL